MSNNNFNKKSKKDTSQNFTTKIMNKYKRSNKFLNNSHIIYSRKAHSSSTSKNEKYDPSYVADKGMSKNKDALIVLTTNPKSKDFWAIAVITIENNKYVHRNDCARAGKELSTKMFKYYTGQGELADDDYNLYDAIR